MALDSVEARMSLDARAKALSALARFQVADSTVGDTLDRIAVITLAALPAAAAAGMSVLGEDEQPTTAIYTDEESPEIDAAQYREGKGPCLDAWRYNRVIRVDRVEDWAETYPAFAASMSIPAPPTATAVMDPSPRNCGERVGSVPQNRC